MKLYNHEKQDIYEPKIKELQLCVKGGNIPESGVCGINGHSPPPPPPPPPPVLSLGEHREAHCKLIHHTVELNFIIINWLMNSKFNLQKSWKQTTYHCNKLQISWYLLCNYGKLICLWLLQEVMVMIKVDHFIMPF